MSAYALPGFFSFPSSLPKNDAKLVDKKTISSSFKNLGEIQANTSQVSKDSESSPLPSKQNGLLISIKSATVDHIQLIQAFAAPASKNSFRDKVASLSNSLTSFTLGSQGSDGGDEQWGEYDDCSNEFSYSPSNISLEESHLENQKEFMVPNQFVSASVHSDSSSKPVHATLEKSNAHDDAIHFTLSISFHGRNYTATRALPTFVKLRNDLMLELQGLSTKRFHRPGAFYSSEHQLAKNSNDSSRLLSKKMSRNDGEIVIPELPIGDNKVDGIMSMAGRGFRGLQETVCSYCPMMEQWIRNVADLCPSSPSLANFLWEPMQHTDQNKALNGRSYSSPPHSPTKASSLGGNNKSSMRGRIGSMQTLNSIFESEATYSESDSECDDFAF